MRFNFLQATDRSSWYSFDQTQEEERQSQPWGYPVVLNPGSLQSVLTPHLFPPQKDGEELTTKFEHRTMRMQYFNHQRTCLSVTFLNCFDNQLFSYANRKRNQSWQHEFTVYLYWNICKIQLDYQIIFIFISFLSALRKFSYIWRMLQYKFTV